jgi:UDPglucose 6-dehydrogenase
VARHPNISVLVNPEFLREGFSLIDFEAPSRVVIGGDDRQAVDDLASLYTFADGGMIRTDPTTAEIIKLGSNSALAVRVSLANEVAHLADSFGADVETVLGGIGEDPRIGRAYLTPGIGFGGSCLPKDLSALRATALRQGVATAVFDGAERTNEIALERLIDRAIASRGDRETAHISVVGAAFKPGSDSVRNSRAILLIRGLVAEGFSVRVFDPPAETGARIELGDSVAYASSLQEALTGADLAIVVDRTLLSGAWGQGGEVPRLIDSLGREVVTP